MTATWRAMVRADVGLTVAIVDYPHTDASDWRCATHAALRVRAATGRPLAIAATLPELLPEDIAEELLAGDVIALHGLTEAVRAAEIAATLPPFQTAAPLPGGEVTAAEVLTEAEGKVRAVQR